MITLMKRLLLRIPGVQKKKPIIGFVIAGVAVLGIAATLASRAAGPFVAAEPEAGAVSSPVVIVADTTVSGGSAIKFASGAGGSCIGAKHTPGGPDGFGGCWPAAYSTGYPHGLPGDTRAPVTLTNYTGPSGYQDPGTMVIDKKIVNSELRFYGHANVTITNSLIKGHIDFDLADATSTLTIRDTEVDAGGFIGAAMGNRYWTATRLDTHGGTTGVSCLINCSLTDSYIHGNYLPPSGDYHLGGFLSNGGPNITSIHNSIMCDAGHNADGGNCSGDLNFFGDAAPVSNILVDKTLFGANPDISYCTYAGDSDPTANGHKPYPYADHVVYQNSIFQKGTTGKCGGYGPVSGFNPAEPGNQWINNFWDDGTVIQSAN
jgi:hypothetical protein